MRGEGGGTGPLLGGPQRGGGGGRPPPAPAEAEADAAAGAAEDAGGAGSRSLGSRRLWRLFFFLERLRELPPQSIDFRLFDRVTS